ncbi:glycosyltransferase family 2 protein [Pedobacter metabolipauper]|uniref:Glycosyltransferase involved in cell wall biosynthesis n=1 Tax=Pedobacter metabolipauper TaxID=425513 RepID=A0A4R6SXI8_9SPHI|nr:glycosyltransferase family 2 protein [Pedobacter metabolipauper]TDQ09364.1 glycosyltransferase involved in cell wall biosynthesis [Pedobacter metabolipauper]
MPKVSVIIPNYNHSKYLVQRIESILDQTYQDFEIIILDDCSTDQSRSIIEGYRLNPKVTEIIYNEQNSGSTFKQWEKGISIAHGELIWIAESDDWCDPIILEELISGFDKDENCIFSYCQSYCIQNVNTISWQSQHPYLSEIVEGHVFIKNYMLKNNSVFNASMVLWKKEVYKSIPKDFTDYKFCGDWLFWIELARHGTIHISGKLLNYFRKHDQDVSGKATKSGLNYKEILTVLNRIYRDQLITDADYNNAFKYHLKAYWKDRNALEPLISKQIEQLFKNPASQKTNYYKAVLSAIWYNRKDHDH